MNINVRYTNAQKTDKWYEEIADYYINRLNSFTNSENKREARINIDLYNNILNEEDFRDVCYPYGEEVGKVTTLENRDISSSKIKKLLGLLLKRSFVYRAIATNPEATTDREEKTYAEVKNFVVRKLKDATKEEETPEKLLKYLKRNYNTPSEVLSNQLINYFKRFLNLKDVFKSAMLDFLLTGVNAVYLGVFNEKIIAKTVSPLDIEYEASDSSMFLEDSTSIVATYYMDFSELISQFSEELSESDIDNLSTNFNYSSEDLFQSIDYKNNKYTVKHVCFKSLRKIGIIGEGSNKTIVDENYPFKKEVRWEWIPETYEVWKVCISKPLYLRKSPIVGQFKDVNNLYSAKMPYFGIITEEVSFMSRLKTYQYAYTILSSKIDSLIKSDKGKKILMNINAIPDSKGIDIHTWQQFFEKSPFMWYDPTEEGNNTTVDQVAKILDFSLISDINNYISVAEYIRLQAGKSVGIPEQMEGQISQYEAVGNTQQALVNSSDILELIFNLDDLLKKNVYTALIELSKAAYANKENASLSYALDDLSVEMFKYDLNLLDNSTINIFVENLKDTNKLQEIIISLSQAALQNGKADFSDVIAIMNQDSPAEAKEILLLAEERRAKQEEKLRLQKIEEIKVQQQLEAERETVKHNRDKELIILKEEEQRKTELLKSTIMGASFNPDIDKNNNGQNDFIDLLKLEQKTEVDKRKLDLEEEKLKIMKENAKKTN